MKRKVYLLLVMSLLVFGLAACRFSGDTLLPQLPTLNVPTEIQNLELPVIPAVAENTALISSRSRSPPIRVAGLVRALSLTTPGMW
jgi:hypothetical protein